MNITIIGMGYIGLPVACAFADKGVSVYGIEKNEDIINKLINKLYDYTEPNINDKLNKHIGHNLIISNRITGGDVYIITVQTPLNSSGKPDNTYVYNALDDLIPFIKQNDLIILESTVTLGANREFYNYLRNRIDYNISFDYCYCPESILPGNIFYEIEHNNRVLGALTKREALRAKCIYDIINDSDKDICTLEEAEFVKITQNAHRDVELAFVNQLSMMCDKVNVDPFKVINMANKHPRCNLLQPGSGVGGHCIAVDPNFLIDYFGCDASLIKESRRINNYKPIYIGDKAISLINNDTTKIVGVLGLSYKSNSEDTRESSGLIIAKYILSKGYKVLTNEYNSRLDIIDDFKNDCIEFVINNSDILIIAQGHDKYKTIDFKNKKVLDCVNIIK